MAFTVNHSFDYHFVMLLDKLEKKYGSEMFELEGISRKQLDIAKFTNKFLETKTTSDISIDGNANVDDMSILSWNYEMPKPLAKLNALYHLWKDALRKHGIKRANKFIELEISGAIRIHDLHGWLMPYCWAASLAPIVNTGMPWVKNIKVGPVKHFSTFISNSIKYIYNLSTQCVGAIAVPDFLAYAEYFIRKDYGEEWYNDPRSIREVEQGFQQWIFGVNDKARGNQSPFTNVSVFDKYWREAMFGKHTNPDFTTCNLDNLKRVQRYFVEVLVKEQENNVFTFPVMTGCQLKDKETGEIIDKDWLDWIAGISVKNKLINFYTSDSVDSLSSCLFKGNIITVFNKVTKQQEIIDIADFVGKFIDINETDKDININDYQIEAYNILTGKKELVDIKTVIKRTNKSGLKVTISTGDEEISVSPDHIIAIRNTKTNEISEITAGELVNMDYNCYEIAIEG
jgi:ribonucleoside-triphosphate reductase